MTMHQGLDLSRFKKVSSDKKTTTLRHAKGHEIKIAHSGLTPKMREHIDSLEQHVGGDEVAQRFAEGTPDEPVTKPLDPATPAPIQQDAAAPQSPQQAAPEQGGIPPKPDVMPVAGEVQVQAQRPAYNPINPEELRMQNALWQQDLANGHVKPETYHDLFAKKDTLGKIGTLFGLMVSGAGAGLSHQPNAVMEMMNKEIANDLDAQKASKVNANNFLELNRKQTLDMATIEKMRQEGVLNEAQAKAMIADANTKSYSLARMQMNSAALHRLVDQVNKMPVGSPQRQQAEQQLALLSKGIEGENYSIADKAAVAGALSSLAFNGGGTQGGDNPESGFQQGQTALRVSGNEPLANDREGKHMPGVEGQASIPLTSDDRGKINEMISFQTKLNEMKDFVAAHKGAEKLDLKDRAKGEAMAAELQNAYRGAINGGVYKPSEQDFIGKIISSTPTKFFDEIRVTPGLDVVQHNSQSDLNQFVKSKGFKGYTFKGKDKLEGRTIVDKNGNRQIRKDGKWVPMDKSTQAKK